MYEIYTLKEVDNINSILSKYNINMDELMKLNGIIDLDNLKEGMQVIVPVNDSSIYNYYTVKKGDTIYRIANDYGIDVDLLLALNGLDEGDYIYQNQTLMIPKDGIDLYLTKNNDTIKSVIDKKNITLDKLFKDNENIYLKEEQILVFLDK